MNTLFPSRPSARRNPFLFLGIAGVTAFTLHVLFVTTGAHEAVREVPVLKEWIPPPPRPKTTKLVFESCPDFPLDAPAPTATSRTHGALVPSVEKEDDNWDIERVKKMVATTKGFYARDYSLGLGWNNVRYIIEASLIHAHTLNRTLVLPSFVYARACEWDIHVCAAFSHMVNRGDAIGWAEWRDLPIEQQMGWRIPMENMIDLPHLRKTYSVVLIREYLEMHGLDPGIEWSNGAWHDKDYHRNTKPESTLAVIPNKDYDPSGVVRVDTLKGIRDVSKNQGPLHQRLLETLGDEQALDWETVKKVSEGLWKSLSDDEITTELEKNGWTTLYTYEGANGLDLMKSVIVPTRQVAPYSRLKGLVDDYGDSSETVLVLRGETHLRRKPGALRFTTPTARDSFTRAVLYSMRPPANVRKLAQVLHDRMMQRVGGRMWMAAHMRRGDFVRLGWAMEAKIEDHLARVKDRLDKGRQVLQTISTTKELQKYDVPDSRTDINQVRLEPPRSGDKFYIATDERDPKALKYLRDHGAILISDLLEPADMREFDWGIMLTDVLALVEQSLMSKAYFFYAHALSSVAGGALNLRAARGVDPRATVFD
ncbi:hypothetical protein FRC02_000600 [Tulasnella sp. 418]|nr:hypothetical protein FRC02_000600 [Tulasnella sp. 418]